LLLASTKRFAVLGHEPKLRTQHSERGRKCHDLEQVLSVAICKWGCHEEYGLQ
jgi:hypothetical protein